MPSPKFLPLLLLLLCWLSSSSAGSGAQGGDIHLGASSGGLNEEKVENLLLQDEEDEEDSAAGGADERKPRAPRPELQLYVTQYLQNFQLSLTAEDALALAATVKEDTAEDVNVRLTQVGKMLDAAEILRKKLNRCPGGQDKLVSSYLDRRANAYNLKHKLVKISNAFVCPPPPKETQTSKKTADSNRQNQQQNSVEATDDDGLAASTKDLFGKGLDFTFLSKLKKDLKEKPLPVLNSLVSWLKKKGFVTKEMLPMVEMVKAQLVSTPEYMEWPVGAIDSLEAFFKSESGKRMLKIVPQLMDANTETALELFAREAGYNREAFFNLLKNTDMANHFVKSVARALISSFTFAQDALEDTIKMAIVNGMLMNYGFPMVDKRNLLYSAIGIAVQASKYVTVHRVEDMDIYGEARKLQQEFERLYFKFSDLGKLSEKELENAVGQFLSETALHPVGDAWLANRKVTMTDERCAPLVLCLFNRNYGKDNLLVRTLVRGTTQGIAYSWSSLYGDEMGYDDLNAAILQGADVEGKACEDIYADVSAKTCDVFQHDKSLMRSKGMMDLGYEHQEL